MTNTKHTPGPWAEGMDGSIFSAGKFICNPFENNQLCPKIEEQEANAHLITAAPELLEACEYVLRTLRAPDCPSIPDGAYMRGKIIIAIKKAKGE